MSRMAIIPARGGSKRIPRKNVRDFHGKPIIAYSIETAIKSGLFDEVMVSTDDAEIAEIAKNYGAKVPFLRSEINSDDTATTLQVVQEVMTFYTDRSLVFEEVCCIYATAPLVQVEHLKKGLKLLQEIEVTSVFPVVPYSFPIQRSFSIDDNQCAKLNWPEHVNTRSQDLQPAYHDAGQWYWLKPSKLSDKIFTDNSKVIVLSEMEVQDIDNESDWKMAELKWKIANH